MPLRSTSTVTFLQSKEDVLELVHPGIDEEERRIIVRHERGAVNHTVPSFLEKTEKALSELRGCHVVLILHSVMLCLCLQGFAKPVESPRG